MKKTPIGLNGYFTDGTMRPLSGGRVVCSADAGDASISLDAEGVPVSGQSMYDTYSFPQPVFYSVKTYDAKGQLWFSQRNVTVSAVDGSIDFSKVERIGFFKHHAPATATAAPRELTEEEKRNLIAQIDKQKDCLRQERTKYIYGRRSIKSVPIASASSDPPAQRAFCDRQGGRLSGGKIIITGRVSSLWSEQGKDNTEEIRLDDAGIPLPEQTVLDYEMFLMEILSSSGTLVSRFEGCTIENTGGMFDLGNVVVPRLHLEPVKEGILA